MSSSETRVLHPSSVNVKDEDIKMDAILREKLTQMNLRCPRSHPALKFNTLKEVCAYDFASFAKVKDENSKNDKENAASKSSSHLVSGQQQCVGFAADKSFMKELMYYVDKAEKLGEDHVQSLVAADKEESMRKWEEGMAKRKTAKKMRQSSSSASPSSPSGATDERKNQTKYAAQNEKGLTPFDPESKSGYGNRYEDEVPSHELHLHQIFEMEGINFFCFHHLELFTRRQMSFHAGLRDLEKANQIPHRIDHGSIWKWKVTDDLQSKVIPLCKQKSPFLQNPRATLLVEATNSGVSFCAAQLRFPAEMQGCSGFFVANYFHRKPYVESFTDISIQDLESFFGAMAVHRWIAVGAVFSPSFVSMWNDGRLIDLLSEFGCKKEDLRAFKVKVGSKLAFVGRKKATADFASFYVGDDSAYVKRHLSKKIYAGASTGENNFSQEKMASDIDGLIQMGLLIESFKPGGTCHSSPGIAGVNSIPKLSAVKFNEKPSRIMNPQISRGAFEDKIVHVPIFPMMVGRVYMLSLLENMLQGANDAGGKYFGFVNTKDGFKFNKNAKECPNLTRCLTKFVRESGICTNSHFSTIYVAKMTESSFIIPLKHPSSQMMVSILGCAKSEGVFVSASNKEGSDEVTRNAYKIVFEQSIALPVVDVDETVFATRKCFNISDGMSRMIILHTTNHEPLKNVEINVVINVNENGADEKNLNGSGPAKAENSDRYLLIAYNHPFAPAFMSAELLTDSRKFEFRVQDVPDEERASLSDKLGDSVKIYDEEDVAGQKWEGEKQKDNDVEMGEVMRRENDKEKRDGKEEEHERTSDVEMTLNYECDA